MEITREKTFPQGSMTTDLEGGTVGFLGEDVYVLNNLGWLVKMNSVEWQDIFDGKTELPEGPPPSSAP